jgi:hypothetical protein
LAEAPGTPGSVSAAELAEWKGPVLLLARALVKWKGPVSLLARAWAKWKEPASLLALRLATAKVIRTEAVLGSKAEVPEYLELAETPGESN